MPIDTSDPILQVFLQEGAEQIETLNSLLLRLESVPHDRDLIGEIMRTAHNLKGASGTAGLPAISEAAHKFEDVIQRLRNGLLPPSPRLFDLLFKTTDGLQTCLQEIALGKEEDPDLTLVLAGLEGMLRTRQEDQSGGSLDRGDDRTFGFLLGEYDHVRLRVLKQRGKHLFELDVAINDEEKDPVKWTQRALQLLRNNCEIVATNPQEQDLSTVAVTHKFSALLGTSLTPAELERALDHEHPRTCEVKDLQDASPGNGEHAALKARASMKVDLSRVDGLVDMIGELVITQSMVASAPEILALPSRSVRSYLSQLTRITRELQDAGLRLRMVPLKSTFQGMARTVRDLARKHGKTVIFVGTGEDVEMDRSVVEGIADPLVHLVRNAVDHGAESPAARQAAGKPQTATITLSAYHQGGNIVVEVSDDGAGLDPEKLLNRARALGLVREGTEPGHAEILNFIFESGFSTTEQVNDTSGRGVGLDIVRRNVEGMRGRVTVTSQAGRGTTFRMILPLTLAIIDGMLIACGGECYIIPTIAIVESTRPVPSALSSVAQRWQILNMRGQILPLVPLGQLLNIPAAGTDPSKGLVVVVEGINRRVGLVVDDVLSQQQVVIKNLGSGLGNARYLSGAAILPDGRVGLILNIDEIAAAGAGEGRAA